MTIIVPDVSFNAFNKNKNVNEFGQQYLDAEEVKTAHSQGAKWACKGQTETQYNEAKLAYQAQKKAEFRASLSKLDLQDKNLTLKKAFEKMGNNEQGNEKLTIGGQESCDLLNNSRGRINLVF